MSSLNYGEVWETAGAQFIAAATAWASFQATQPTSVEGSLTVQDALPRAGDKRRQEEPPEPEVPGPHAASAYGRAVQQLFRSRAARLNDLQEQLGPELSDLAELLDDRANYPEPPNEDEDSALRGLHRGLTNIQSLLRRELHAWSDLWERSRELRAMAQPLTALPAHVRDPFSAVPRQLQVGSPEEQAEVAAVNAATRTAFAAEGDIVRGLHGMTHDLARRVRDMITPAEPPVVDSSDGDSA